MDTPDAEALHNGKVLASVSLRCIYTRPPEQMGLPLLHHAKQGTALSTIGRCYHQYIHPYFSWPVRFSDKLLAPYIAMQV